MAACSGVRKVTNDREVRAVFHNMKEQRMLEKSYQSLDLEGEYSQKLLNLTHSEMKLSQLRLKSRVSKIKSHLNAAEIAELRILDLRGKLHYESNTAPSLNSARIASAMKRLKLNSDSRRAKSARYGIPLREPQQNYKNNGPISSPTISNGKQLTGTSKPAVVNMGKDFSVKNEHQVPNKKSGPPLRPMTSNGFSTTTHQQNSPRPQRPLTAHGANYSSHLIQEKQKNNSVQNGGGSRFDFSADVTIGCDIAKLRAEEHRQELLEDEQQKSCDLANKRQMFLNKAARWVEENPQEPVDMIDDHMSTTQRLLHAEISPATKARKRVQKKPKVPQVSIQEVKTIKEEIEQEAPIDSNQNEPVPFGWQDLKKCRYLRISDDDVDLSGVDTLAKNQFGLFQLIQQKSMQKRSTFQPEPPATSQSRKTPVLR